MKRTALAALPAFVLFASSARAQVKVEIDPAADVHPISPLVYGLNFPTDQHIIDGRITAGRWGGNTTSRYNYLIDASNTGSDYFFENVPGCWTDSAGWCALPPSDPKEQSSANLFLGRLAIMDVVALFTVPTIGWVAKAPAKYDHPFDCGCKGPGQDDYDPYEPSCGNGLVNNQPMDCGAPTTTSTAIDPAFVKDWISYLTAKLGPAAGKRIYALDNEPGLWSSTHHDVRGSARLGYDELWQRMRDHALAILDADPTAEIAGPAEWGWPNYFCSDKDDVSQGCSASSPDRAAHGGEELMAWLLDQARMYEQQNGKRILHYLDLHYYPQGDSGPESTRSLWDKTYTDPSWIYDTIYLVPRMRDWVSQHYPGTKLAVSEYDFHDHDQPVSAVTYAEVLGIFGREGLDLATAWAPPETSEAAFAAFKLYRNYDGQGSSFESQSVRATVTGDGVRAYAAAGPSRLTVVLANQKSASAQVDVTLGNFMADGSAAVFQHEGAGSTIVALGPTAVQGGAVHLTLPGTSITLLAVTGTNPNLPPTSSSSVSSAGSGNGSSGNGSSSNGGSGSASNGGSGGNAPHGDGGSGGSIPGAKGTCGCGTAPDSDLAPAWTALSVLSLLVRRRRRGLRHVTRP
ncbi:MAG: glycoside hydrolase family 44 protein [Minicystis sp.]